ncbi:MAG: hypothetical protein WCO99_06245, partial [Planctomycetota bacterium]
HRASQVKNLRLQGEHQTQYRASQLKNLRLRVEPIALPNGSCGPTVGAGFPTCTRPSIEHRR